MTRHRTLPRRWAARWAVGVVLATAATPAAWARQVWPAPAEPVPAEYFGIHVHRFHDARMRPTVRFGAWRLWGAGVEWARLQPAPDRWDFRRLDLAVDLARRGGMDLLLTLGQTPQWASRQPQLRSFTFQGAAAPPAEVRAFERYVQEVATRYRGRISKFEVWNEPGSSGMFAGSVEDMVALTEAAARAIKQVDPDNLLVCPSPAKEVSLGWFERFLRAGGAGPCDVIAYHFYTDGAGPETRLALIARVRELMRRHGAGDKPLWDTESGFGPARKDDPGAPDGRLARAMLLTWVGGVERFYWYAWDHRHYGFVDPETETVRGRVGTMELVRQWMLDARVRSCQSDGPRWHCTLTTTQGRPAHVHWHTGPGATTVPADCAGRLQRLDGSLDQVRRAQPVPVDGDPLYLECEA